jgi:alkylmercury lyase
MAFAAIRLGRRPAAGEIAASAGMRPDVVSAELRRLAASGEANLDEEGHVVAVAGLSVVPARHDLLLAGRPLHTWCAWDAIGIPAALDEDATIATRCGWCDRPIRIQLSRGGVVGAPAAALWFPSRPARGGWDGNPQEDWCPQANLFCGAEHLHEWRAAHADSIGEAITVEEAARRGADHWAIFREIP